MNLTGLNSFFKIGAIAMAGAVMLSPAEALTVYKSIGDFGEVKYSQFPPKEGKGVEVIELRNDGRQVDAGAMAGKTDATQKAPPTPEEQRIAQLETQMKEQKEKENAQRCQNLRNNLANLNIGGRLYKPDDKGGRQFLSSAEIDQERANMQKLIQEHCSGAST